MSVRSARKLRNGPTVSWYSIWARPLVIVLTTGSTVPLISWASTLNAATMTMNVELRIARASLAAVATTPTSTANS